LVSIPADACWLERGCREALIALAVNSFIGHVASEVSKEIIAEPLERPLPLRIFRPINVGLRAEMGICAKRVGEGHKIGFNPNTA